MDDEMDEDAGGEWYPTGGGATVNDRGPEGGYVLRDEEWGDPEDPEDADARVTLEAGDAENPGRFVTAQLYGGWLYHTMRVATDAEAETVYAAMRARLETLVAMIPYDDDRGVDAKVSALTDACAAFEREF